MFYYKNRIFEIDYKPSTSDYYTKHVIVVYIMSVCIDPHWAVLGIVITKWEYFNPDNKVEKETCVSGPKEDCRQSVVSFEKFNIRFYEIFMMCPWSRISIFSVLLTVRIRADKRYSYETITYFKKYCIIFFNFPIQNPKSLFI